MPPCGVSRLEGRPTGSLAHCIRSKLQRLRLALAPTSCCPPANGTRDGRLLFHGSFTDVFDVKENVRVTLITPYDQRCVVLSFHTIVDAPCLSRCNRA